jgi:hypothetical protein
MHENVREMMESPKERFNEYLRVKRGLRLPTHRERRVNNVPQTGAGIVVEFDGGK